MEKPLSHQLKVFFGFASLGCLSFLEGVSRHALEVFREVARAQALKLSHLGHCAFALLPCPLLALDELRVESESPDMQLFRNWLSPSRAALGFFVRASLRFQSPEIHMSRQRDSWSCSRSWYACKALRALLKPQHWPLAAGHSVEATFAVSGHNAIEELHHEVCSCQLISWR